MMQGMAGRVPDTGEAAHTVASNVARIRTSQNLTWTQLSDRLSDLGWNLTPVAVKNIESERRRVTVDDLVALAVALGVSPVTLLTPNSPEGSDMVQYTALPQPISSEDLLDWLTGKFPLPNSGSSVLEFYARALPLWMREGMIAALRRTNRDFPPSDGAERRFWGFDGDDQ